MKSRKLVCTVIFMAVFFLGKAQEIKGNVSTTAGEPLQNVTIYYGNEKMVTTDFFGNFTFNLDVAFPFTLTFVSETNDRENHVMTANNQLFIVDTFNVSEVLPPVLLSTNYKRESRVLTPTTRITQETIDNADPVTLVNAINQTPGVYIQRGAINTNRITIRGVGSRTLFGTNKIRAYYNGIPITNGAGETSIDAFNVHTISNIEIVKGPKATQYGTNLGGTLLLSTKEPELAGTTVYNTTNVGSYGLLQNTTTGSYKDDNLLLHASYWHLKLDGYRDNNAYNRNNYLITARQQLNVNVSLDVLLQHTNNNAQIPSSLSQTAISEDPTQAAFTWGQAKGFEDNRETLSGISLNTKLSPTWSNTTTLYYRYLDHYEPRPFNILDEYTNGYGGRTLFAKKLVLNDLEGSITAGAEYNRDMYHWKTIENRYEENNGNGSLEGELLSVNREKRSQISLFATTTLPLTKKLTTEIGLHYNKNSYDYSDLFNEGELNSSAERSFDGIFAPNFSLLYAPTTMLDLYASVSRGFNYPTLEETLTPDGVINPDIGPERGWNYEVGTSIFAFSRALRLQANVYLLSITDLLVAERVGEDQFIGRNAGKTHHRGIEFAIDYQLTISKGLAVKSYINSEFSFHKFIDFVDGDDDFSGNDLTGVPDKKITAGILATHRSGIYLNMNFRHIGSQPITDANTLYSDTYNVTDVKAGFKKSISEALEIEVAAGINNLANEQYASSILINASSFGGSEPRYFYPGLNRNYFGTLQLRYSL